MPLTPVTVAVVNDDELVVRGLDAMLRTYSNRVRVVELTASKPVASSVDIALYDTFALSQGNGPGVARLMANPRVSKVVVYTWNFQSWLARETMATGVCGYLSKSLPAAQLVHALEKVHGGQRIVSPSSGRRGQAGGDWPGREEGLTAREAEVLLLITLGLSNLEIAERTLLSPNSVKGYIRTCYRKIGVDSRSKAVLWAMARGMGPDRIRIEGSPAQAQAQAQARASATARTA